MKKIRAVFYTTEYYRTTVEFEIDKRADEDKVMEEAHRQAFDVESGWTKLVDSETDDIEIEEVE